MKRHSIINFLVGLVIAVSPYIPVINQIWGPSLTSQMSSLITMVGVLYSLISLSITLLLYAQSSQIKGIGQSLEEGLEGINSTKLRDDEFYNDFLSEIITAKNSVSYHILQIIDPKMQEGPIEINTTRTSLVQ